MLNCYQISNWILNAELQQARLPIIFGCSKRAGFLRVNLAFLKRAGFLCVILAFVKRAGFLCVILGNEKSAAPRGTRAKNARGFYTGFSNWGAGFPRVFLKIKNPRAFCQPWLLLTNSAGYFIQPSWYSGNTIARQAVVPGSIPGLGNLFFSDYFPRLIVLLLFVPPSLYFPFFKFFACGGLR